MLLSSHRTGLPLVVLYGNAETNEIWSQVVPEDSSIRVRQGSARVGERSFDGEDLIVLFGVRAQRAAYEACVVAPTGPRGARLELLSLLAELELPDADWVVLGPCDEAPGVRVIASGALPE